MFTLITKQLRNDSPAGGANTALEDALFKGFGNAGDTEPDSKDGDPKKSDDPKPDPKDNPPTNEQEVKTLETLLAKEESELTPEEKVQLEALKVKYDVKEIDSDSDEEKAKAAELEKKIAAIKAKPQDQRTLEEIKFLKDNEASKLTVYQKVDELSGIPVQVEYGDTDPQSPEGIVLRETAIREQAEQQYDELLKQSNPLGYQFMLHVSQGGDPYTFLRSNTESYKDVTLVKADVATQERILRTSLEGTGLSKEDIDDQITLYKDKGKLFDKASEKLIVLQKKQVEEENKRIEADAKEKARDKKLISDFYKTIDEKFIKGVKGVVIPKTEQAAFKTFITENTRHIDGKLIFTKVFDDKDMDAELATLYFRYKGGDLKPLVERKAKDLNADGKRKAIKYSITPKSSKQENTNYVPLSEI